MPPPPKIPFEIAGKAIDALQTFLQSSAKHQKAQLFEHEDFLYLHLSLLRFPSKSRTNPFLIPLPHSLHPLDPSRTSLCLIADSSSSLETTKSTALSSNLPFDSIISLSDLRENYVAFESRRKLCDSYDIFFADRRILTLLPKLIGNYFFKKKKIPIGVNLSRKGWPEAVKRVCASTQMFFGKGTSVGMKVGRVCMGREEIVENVMAAIEGAVSCVPKKWGNVRCVYVKAAHSVSLPIYQVVPEMGMRIVVGEEEKGTKKRKARIHDLDWKEKKKEKKVKEAKFDEFVELGEGGKVRKKAKKVVKLEVEEGLVVDEGNFVKKKVKGKSAKGKKEANVMNGDGDCVDVEDGSLGKRVKKSEKIGKFKVKKVKKIKLRQ